MSRLKTIYSSLMSLGEKYRFGSTVYLRLMGLVYLLAFLSYALQWELLYSDEGLLPVSLFFERLPANYRQNFLEFPALYSFVPHETGQVWLQLLGLAASVALFAGILPKLCSIICYFCYLNFVLTGHTFMSFQWDILLLEAGFLLILLTPWKNFLWLRENFKPNSILLILHWGLLFKLIFSSGIVKVLAGGAWTDLSALQFHFMTQPLPNPLAWWIHQSPQWFLKLSCFITLLVELIPPFFLWVFFWPRVQFLSSFIIISLMILIQFSGNYTFFNLLTIALCLLCLPDRYLPWSFRDRFSKPKPESQLLSHAGFLISVPLILLLLLQFQKIPKLKQYLPQSSVLEKVDRATRLFYVNNSYGLFARMTTIRREINFEYSQDGIHWTEIEFPYKPGPVNRDLPLIAPYQPRLDWQMWFAAMSPSYRSQPWIASLIEGILLNKEQVRNYFPNIDSNTQIRYVRAIVYDYDFTGFGESSIWEKKARSVYLRPIRLR